MGCWRRGGGSCKAPWRSGSYLWRSRSGFGVATTEAVVSTPIRAASKTHLFGSGTWDIPKAAASQEGPGQNVRFGKIISPKRPLGRPKRLLGKVLFKSGPGGLVLLLAWPTVKGQPALGSFEKAGQASSRPDKGGRVKRRAPRCPSFHPQTSKNDLVT